jgi:organic radical activating enzyme
MHFIENGPTLKHLEIHLTDHCNLNCKGCAHFSPLADKWFINLKNLDRDMKRLAQLFYNIEVIKLLGGEPLLHPEVNEIISITRFYMPTADIRCATNGLLLEGMDVKFWLACQKEKITIDIARYAVPLDITKIKKLAKNYKVNFTIRNVKQFYAFYNKKYDSNPFVAMKNCRAHWYCPLLRNGFIYPCCLPALAHYFNREFHTNLSTEGGIDIHDRAIDGVDILEFLDRPISHCRNCAGQYRLFNCGQSQRRITEWFA